MIAKEKTDSIPGDKLEKAGYDAERKVAFYLRMAFDEDPDTLILNDLRLEHKDDITAQIDHLLIHPHGLIIIESKSVTGKLQVRDDGQWVRWYLDKKTGKDRSIGMQDPIKQAKLQGQTLRRVLLDAASEDTRKVLENFPIDILVTVSDGGVFLAHDRLLYPEVCKADKTEEHVKEILLRRAENTKENDFKLSDANKTKLANYLISRHRPYQPAPGSADKTPVPFPTQAAPRSEMVVEQKLAEYVVDTLKKFIGVADTTASSKNKFTHGCRKCGSGNLEIRYVKNYFFRCLDCDTNTRIDATCPGCNRLLKIRKDKDQFFAECKACATSALFFVNK
ncbi:MAG: NERD domain-containing protein [Methylobacillus sp.]|jgi:hypothetical protein|nr:NERD domain-containing protein [Methylobacillus sp.]